MTIIIVKDGKVSKKENIPFEKEDKLQKYVEDIPKIIPIYDIKEGAELLILSREFPTNSGPIDALGIDDDGDIYVIETKRYENPDKRQVIAQILDYGASLFTTSFDEFFNKLDTIIQEKNKVSLLQRLKDVFGIDEEIVLSIKNNMRKSLEEGNFKFVVLMDELEPRLKGLIYFINARSRFSIYAVELEYYQHDGYDIMIPKLYGAETKKALSTEDEMRRTWDEVAFFRDAESRIKNRDQLESLKKLYNASKSIGSKIQWGIGAKRGSFAVYLKIAPRSWYWVYSDGTLWFNTGRMQEIPDTWNYRDEFKQKLVKIGFKVNDDYKEKSPRFLIQDWSPLVDSFIEAVKDLLK